MPSVHEYKRFENNLVRVVKDVVKTAAGAVIGFVSTIFRAITRPYTVVLVPHSEKKVYNLQITIFSVFCFFTILVGVVGAFSRYSASYNNTQGILADKDNRSKNTLASLDQLRDEIPYLLRSARSFEAALSSTLSALGNDFGTPNQGVSTGGGDLSSFFDIKETPEGTLREVEDVRRLAGYLASTEESIRQIGSLLDSQSTLLTEIPSIWPIKGGIGHISMFFGQNENPFNGQYYIHKGIDLSTYRQGDPIVASADGQVVSVEYDVNNLGNNVTIRHKHGFYTRYGHMLSFRVKAGQRVQQGEVIGYIGNTGLSTGPHLHYEVHIGSDVVDPYKYISIRSSIARVAR